MVTIVNKGLSLTIVYGFDYVHKNCRFWKHDRLKKIKCNFIECRLRNDR